MRNDISIPFSKTKGMLFHFRCRSPLWNSLIFWMKNCDLVWIFLADTLVFWTKVRSWTFPRAWLRPWNKLLVPWTVTHGPDWYHRTFKNIIVIFVVKIVWDSLGTSFAYKMKKHVLYTICRPHLLLEYWVNSDLAPVQGRSYYIPGRAETLLAFLVAGRDVGHDIAFWMIQKK